MNRLAIVILCMISGAALRATALELSVASVPELPAANILSDPMFRFENGLDGWVNRYSNEVWCVESAGRGKSFFAPAQDKTVYAVVSSDTVRAGHTYILSCDIKPSPEVSTASLPNGNSGLGCSLAFWDKDWTNAVSLGAYGEGADVWRRISSSPVAIPEWACNGQLHVGVAYSPGSGCVDNIELVEAYAEMSVCAVSSVPIRQVKVVDENWRTVFDSGVLEGGDTAYSNNVPIEAASRYAVFAVDAAGDVRVRFCPLKNAWTDAFFCDGTTYYVDGTAGDDANDGTEDAPFRTIARALAVAEDTDRIRVLPGTYETDETLNVTRAVEIAGLGESAVDTCVASDRPLCQLVVDNANARVVNMSFDNTTGWQPDGVYPAYSARILAGAAVGCDFTGAWGGACVADSGACAESCRGCETGSGAGVSRYVAAGLSTNAISTAVRTRAVSAVTDLCEGMSILVR